MPTMWNVRCTDYSRSARHALLPALPARVTRRREDAAGKTPRPRPIRKGGASLWRRSYGVALGVVEGVALDVAFGVGVFVAPGVKNVLLR